MPPILALFIALASALCAAMSVFALRGRGKSGKLEAQAVLLEEAVVTEPVAPGLEGRASLTRPGAPSTSITVKAIDACQAFARGDRVRIIDVVGGLCIVESADQEHRAR